MRALRIEFVPASPARAWHMAGLRTRLALLAAVALLAAAAVAAGLALRELAAAAQARGALEAAAAARTPRPAPAAELPADEAAAVAAAVDRLNLPWRDVFDAIEQATPDSVALLALEPDARRGAVRLVAEAGSTEDMLRYVERLKQQPFLADVFLTKHAVDERDTNLPLRFQVEARWRAVP